MPRGALNAPAQARCLALACPRCELKPSLQGEEGAGAGVEGDVDQQGGEPALHALGVEAVADPLAGHDAGRRRHHEDKGRAPLDAPPRRGASADAEFTAMTSSDVPTADGMANSRARASTGTMMNPPPTPNRPVRNPTAVLARAILATRSGVRVIRRVRVRTDEPAPASPSGNSTFVQLGQPTRIRHAATRVSPANARSRRSPSSRRLSAEPAIEPPIPTSPNTRPVATRTWPLRQCSYAPTRDAMPTTTSDVEVAEDGDRPTTNTRTGTARMDPPPPRAPSATPTRRPSGDASSARMVMGGSHRRRRRRERAGRHRPPQRGRR